MCSASSKPTITVPSMTMIGTPGGQTPAASEMRSASRAASGSATTSR
jgi:hypothetical protein